MDCVSDMYTAADTHHAGMYEVWAVVCAAALVTFLLSKFNQASVRPVAAPKKGLDDLEMQLNYEFRRSKAVQAMQQQYNERLLSNLHGNAAYLR